MSKLCVIAIFDVGKTNKKLLLLDEQYTLVYQQSCQLPEIFDEDGFACEDVVALSSWIKKTVDALLADDRFCIKGINFSAYGASFVLLDEQLQVMLPLYNYLKPYPPALLQQFYTKYGGESLVARQTASPILGSLNSGMQLYRLRHQHPAVFSRVKYALHLPQYLAFTLHGNVYSDITSIGCHTNLWDFQNQQYHAWVKNEGIEPKLAPIIDSQSVGGFYRQVPVGIGLHDSSAALIPYLVSVAQPFVLLSTGTWCITLNPFNQTQLSDFELHQDCLCFISYKNKAVKASRLFAGYEHEQQIKRLATYFNKPTDYYTTVQYDSALLATDKFTSGSNTSLAGNAMIGQSFFLKRELATFENYEAAYHQLIADLVALQIHSTQIVLNGFAVKQLFVDGGFSNNPVYMQLLANAFPQYQVMAAKLPQATALGAALSMHQHWNSIAMPSDIISFKYYIPKKT